jgi:PhzF family phenazine biosynthesis protein
VDGVDPIERLAAFSIDHTGGNPAGVWLGEVFPTDQAMQETARRVGFSETVFAVRDSTAFHVRYFAPEAEVPFCGHATIALAAALARRQGDGRYDLVLSSGANVRVEGYRRGDLTEAALCSPPTTSRAADDCIVAGLELFNWTGSDLDPRIPPAIIGAGSTHLVLALKDRKLLSEMHYSLESGRAFMRAHGLVTIALVHARERSLDVRNAFAAGGVYEDPATGAAAAALAGYLRDLGHVNSGTIDIVQGEDMGQPCRLQVTFGPTKGSSVKVSGTVRSIG